MFVLTQKLNGSPSRPKPVFYAATMPEKALHPQATTLYALLKPGVLGNPDIEL